MTVTPSSTRDRILKAAYGLFFAKGFGRVAVDAVATSAGLTKRTLYQHFRSKDDLLAAVLEQQSGLGLKTIESWGLRLPDDPHGFVEHLFRDATRWSSKPRWSGPGFTRLVMELADVPGHPARAVARRHKAAVESWLCLELARRGVRHSAAVGRELQILLEGCFALMQIHGNGDYGAAAARAACRLIGVDGIAGPQGFG